MRLNESGIASLIIIGMVAGVFVTGTGVTVVANGSKPGDALYGIDRGAENVQLALAITGSLKVQTHQSIAEERLKEIQALLDEKDVDAPGIANALSNFEDHRSKINEQHESDGKLDENEEKDENELKDKKSKIDKSFENQQKSLENQRESLKKQYEQALKDGDTAKAASLKAQIDGFETLLKTSENARESQKQEVEEEQEAQKQENEAVQKQAEEQSEAEKKAMEAAREAEKQAAEQH